MSVFVKKIVIFLGSVFLVWGLMILLPVCMVPKKHKNFRAHTKRAITKTDIVVMGNSHTANAIDDLIGGGRLTNFSSPGEATYYSAIKARAILTQTGNDTIVIEFGNNAMRTILMALEDNYCYKNYKLYFTKMNLSERAFILTHNTPEALKAILSLNPYYVYINYNHIQGGFSALVGDMIRNPQKPKAKKRPESDRVFTADEEYQNYAKLKEVIAEFPHTFFIITRMPVHDSYYFGGYYKDVELNYQRCVDTLLMLGNCTYLDFYRKVILPDSCYRNTEHLNLIGARIFTPFFLKTISSLTSDKRQKVEEFRGNLGLVQD